MERIAEPGEGTERDIQLGWLAFFRNAVEAKCAGLGADQLVIRSAPPSALSLLGLVRHLTEMEHVYGAWALGPAVGLAYVWGEYVDGGTEWDFAVDTSMVAESMDRWRAERRLTDERISAAGDWDEVTAANGRSVRWNLAKLVQEYARHSGHADLLRERIDGAVGE